MKQILITVLLLFSISQLCAQEIEYKNEVYKLKGKAIYKNGKDVTEELSANERAHITNKIEYERKKLKAEEKKEQIVAKREKELEKR